MGVIAAAQPRHSSMSELNCRVTEVQHKLYDFRSRSDGQEVYQYCPSSPGLFLFQ